MTQTTHTVPTHHLDIIAAARIAFGCDGDDVAAISDQLYEWYVNRVPLPRHAGTRSAIDITPATALRAAHAGAGRFFGGWTVAEQTGIASCLASQDDGTERHLQPGEFRRLSAVGPMRRGERILVEGAWCWVEPDTGFWLTRHGPWTPPGADALARAYFNVTPHQALEVITGLTRTLMGSGTSFLIKTPAATTHVGRADALVLYLGLTDWPKVRDLVIDVGTSRSGSQRGAVPRFAEYLAPGIGWGVGRLDGESFGKLRCDAIGAEVAASRPTTIDQTIECVERALRSVGVDPAAPHCETDDCEY